MATNNSTYERPKYTCFEEAKKVASAAFLEATREELSNKAINYFIAKGYKVEPLPDSRTEVTKLSIRVLTPEGEEIVPSSDLVSLLAWKEKTTGIWRAQDAKSLEKYLPMYWSYVYTYISNPFGVEARAGHKLDVSVLEGVTEKAIVPAATTVPAGNGGSLDVASAMAGLMK